MPRRVFTYHEPVEQIAPWYDAPVLLQRWREAWAEAGWEPVVLDRDAAERHPGWPGFRDAVAAWPSVNAAGYEAANFHRWLAMAAVGGGFLSDADVLPRTAWRPAAGSGLVVHSIDYLDDDQPCPSFVQGGAGDFDAACATFVVAGRRLVAEGARHVSDQELLRTGCLPFEVRPDVLTFGDPRTATAKAIHYKTDAMAHLEGTKSERIAVARAS